MLHSLTLSLAFVLILCILSISKFSLATSVAELPLWRSSVAQPKQSAGFITVSQPDDAPEKQAELFYWHISSSKLDQDNQTVPLVLWLNGGPGCSSLIGLFEENGPFRLRSVTNDSTTASTDTQIELTDNPYSWHHVAHMLFVDQPVGTGMSFAQSDDALARDEGQVTTQLLRLLRGFLMKHPELSSAPLYLAGESYAGKYIPHLALRILQENAAAAKQQGQLPQLKLSGIIMGDALIDPLIQRAVKQDHSYWMGMMSQTQRRQMDELQAQCARRAMTGQFGEKDTACEELKSQLLLASGIINIYDVRRHDPTTNKTRIAEYLNREDVRSALNIPSDKLKLKYEACSKERVYVALQNDILQSTRGIVKRLLNDYKLKTLVYVGNFDLQDGPVGLEHVLLSLDRKSFNESPRDLWFVQNAVAGYVQQDSLLTFLIIHGAGHFVPNDQGLHALAMLETFVSGDGVYCHAGEHIPVRFSALTPSGLNKYLTKKDREYTLPCEVSKLMCESLLGKCNGHGQCSHGGHCVCDAGWAGATCGWSWRNFSEIADNSKSLRLEPHEWQYLSYSQLLRSNHAMQQLHVSIQERRLEGPAKTSPQELIIGGGLGNIMPSRRLCIYGRYQQVGSTEEHQRLPDFLNFDFVQCFDALAQAEATVVLSLPSNESVSGLQVHLGVFNGHPFGISYSIRQAEHSLRVRSNGSTDPIDINEE